MSVCLLACMMPRCDEGEMKRLCQIVKRLNGAVLCMCVVMTGNVLRVGYVYMHSLDCRSYSCCNAAV